MDISLLMNGMQRTIWPLCITATRTNLLGEDRLMCLDEPPLHCAHWNGVTIHFHYTESHQRLEHSPHWLIFKPLLATPITLA